MNDWHFDVGFDDAHNPRIEAFVSNIPDRRFVGLSRTQLENLRAAIDKALKRYPVPGRSAAGDIKDLRDEILCAP